MVRFTFPQAANTAAIGWGGGGSLFADGSISTTVHAASDRTRPFTHHWSDSRTPGSISAVLGVTVSMVPNASAKKWIMTLWKGKERGTPAAIASSVSYGTLSPAPGDIGPFEMRRAP